MPHEPVRPENVLPEVLDLLEAVHDAFVAELPEASSYMQERAWTRRADPHWFPHTVRRGVLERLKLLDHRLEADDDLGAGMSGLMLSKTSSDGSRVVTMRIWKSLDGGAPLMTTQARKDFCRQYRSTQVRLCIGDVGDPERTCNLIVLWDSTDGHDLSQFDLVRPWDVGSNGEVFVDWRVDLLCLFDEEARDEDDLEFEATPDEIEEGSDDGEAEII